MKYNFHVNPHQGSMKICVEYKKGEIQQNYFYLNRDFVIDKCLVDGKEYEITNNIVLESLKTCDGYNANRYSLPQSFQEIRIEYTGYLTGKTGAFPYVRESISPEFTFIRFETFCIPMFFNDDANKSFYEFLSAQTNIDICLTVDEEFTAVANVKEIECHNEKGVRHYTFKAHENNFAIAIAKYEIKNLTVGNFYLLSEIDSNQVEETISMAHNFMNEHFGAREISANVKFAAIPHRFGSFANDIAIFVDESAFNSKESMGHIIHEFIHLGWNAQPDNTITQRIRFFDEAFTSYFEMRVMEHLLNENQLAKYVERYKQQLSDYQYDENVPIIDFGKHEYGGLSYTIGAICLYKISELVGIDVFDNATSKFLEMYKNKPVNMKIFCEEYASLCNMPELEDFFNNWIYGVNGPKSLLASFDSNFEERYTRNFQALSNTEMEKLHTARVCVVGCGGLGGYIIEILARIGVLNITAIDFDVFDPSNLNRQLLATEENLGTAKVQAAAQRVKTINSTVKFTAQETKLMPENAAELLQGHDIIIDALDSIESRLLLEKTCTTLNIPIIHGSIAGWYGQVAFIPPGSGILHILFADTLTNRGIEAELGNLPFTASTVASLQCAECVKFLTGKKTDTKLRQIDLLTGKQWDISI